MNGGDANLNLSEDSSEDGEEEADRSMFDEDKAESVKEKAVKRKRTSELEADEEAKRSSVN